MRFSVKVSVEVSRKLSQEGDFREVIQEQLIEAIPESVYYSDEDGNEHELSVEVIE
jgi:hypothetical protein